MFWKRRVTALSPAEGYQIWAKSYHQEDNPIKRMSDHFITQSMGNLSGLSVLDAGCGTGKLCIGAMQLGAASVHGIDLSSAMVEQARKNCPTATYTCADLSTASIEKERYDLVICGLVLGHIDSLDPVLSRLAQSVRRGGRIVLTDFHPYQSLTNARRTFQGSFGKVYEVTHRAHMIGDYFRILKQERFTIQDFREPLYQRVPAIFGITASK